MKILLAIITGIVVYTAIIGEFMYNIIEKLRILLLADDTLPILKAIIDICVIILLSILGSILAPLVIYVLISEYIKYGECFSVRSEL